MGTFHQDKGELHGITVAVETRDRVYVGRCDTETPEGIVLLDGDLHEDGAEGRSRADYLAQAAAYGVWKRYDRIVVPRPEIVSVRRLGELRR